MWSDMKFKFEFDEIGTISFRDSSSLAKLSSGDLIQRKSCKK